MSNFRPLAIVGRGSEIQLRVDENLRKITYREKIKHQVFSFHFHTTCQLLQVSPRREYMYQKSPRGQNFLILRDRIKGHFFLN